MCTLTYIPRKARGYWWTHNRDESPFRQAKGLRRNADLIYPEEPVSGGSWVGAKDNQRVVSLLNGAFEQVPYQPSTGKSRGIVLLDSLKTTDLPYFFEHYELTTVQPFTLVIRDKERLWDFRWDTQERYLQELDITKPYIWSASLLYSQDWKKKRKLWFNQFLQQQDVMTKEAILDFHTQAGKEYPEQGLIMDRKVVKTVSITNIEHREQSLALNYHSLLKQTTEHFKLEWSNGKKMESKRTGKPL